jgi:hypothetical protein
VNITFQTTTSSAEQLSEEGLSVAMGAQSAASLSLLKSDFKVLK